MKNQLFKFLTIFFLFFIYFHKDAQAVIELTCDKSNIYIDKKKKKIGGKKNLKYNYRNIGIDQIIFEVVFFSQNKTSI